MESTRPRLRPESMSGPGSQHEFIQRLLRSLARRGEEGDTEALEALLAIEAELPGLIRACGASLHEAGYSWSEVGSVAGLTRQGAQQRFGGRPTATR